VFTVSSAARDQQNVRNESSFHSGYPKFAAEDFLQAVKHNHTIHYDV